jgi:regulator of replication initiation timing
MPALSSAEHAAIQRLSMDRRNESARVGRLLRQLEALRAHNARLLAENQRLRTCLDGVHAEYAAILQRHERRHQASQEIINDFLTPSPRRLRAAARRETSMAAPSRME